MCKEKFQERITELYRESQMTVKQFAEKCDMSRQSMDYYLKGDRMPDSEGLQKICSVCVVSADWLLGLTDTRNLSADVQSAVMYTGLPESTIELIAGLQQEDKAALSDIVEDPEFLPVLIDFAFFKLLLNKIENYDQIDADPQVTTEGNRITMNLYAAADLVGSMVSTDFSRIIEHKKNKKYRELFELSSGKAGPEDQH